tara:strand:+ start:3229 stop:3696 length:468 start_codon:yes stop_codon:yes gene_type:complete
MSKRILSLFMVIVMAFLPTVVLAQDAEEEGKLTTINKGELAPYSGILLDSIAAAKINVDKKYSLLKYDLELDLEIKKIKAQYDLQLGTLQAQHDSLEDKHISLLKIKNDEINRLRDILKDNPNDYNHWWMAGGVVAGIVTSIAIFYAAVEIKENE